MEFAASLKVVEQQALRLLGYGEHPPDEATGKRLAAAGKAVQSVAMPRWVHARFALEMQSGGQPGVFLPQAGLQLQGADIAAHLEECSACILLALTLGSGVEQLIRAAEAGDMAGAVLLDACASALTEQYADLAEATLRNGAAQAGEYLTGRFSPGYGDLPLETQRPLLALLNADRAIGLSAAPSGILLPRKSVTAIMGVCWHPVSGRLASCENCALREACAARQQRLCDV